MTRMDRAAARAARGWRSVRRAAAAAGLTLVIMAGAQAQDMGAAIRGVISDQFQAFRDGDVETAFGFASPMIQGMFRTPERFGDMVRNGYPMVWRPAETRFSRLEERGGRVFQDVQIVDQEGRQHLLEYEMILTEDGWEINGVRFKQPETPGV